jgi:hypothetical protein
MVLVIGGVFAQAALAPVGEGGKLSLVPRIAGQHSVAPDV